MPQGENDKPALLPPGVGEGEVGELNGTAFIEEYIDIDRAGTVFNRPDTAEFRLNGEAGG
jgi:hypothetical protein